MICVLLAAGEGRRLLPLTAERPKCLVELAGRSLLARQLSVLESVGLEHIVVVTGYRAEQIEALGLETRHNPRFASTNMVHSLMCASEYLDGRDDVLVAYSDIAYEPRIAHALLDVDRPLATTVDTRWRELWSLRMEDPLSDAETLRLDGAGNVRELGDRPQGYADIEGQYMGLIRLRRDFAPTFAQAYRELPAARCAGGADPSRIQMTEYLQHLIDAGHELHAVLVERGWLEIDSTEDLASYERSFRDGSLDRLCRLHGRSSRLGGAAPRLSPACAGAGRSSRGPGPCSTCNATGCWRRAPRKDCVSCRGGWHRPRARGVRPLSPGPSHRPP